MINCLQATHISRTFTFTSVVCEEDFSGKINAMQWVIFSMSKVKKALIIFLLTIKLMVVTHGSKIAEMKIKKGNILITSKATKLKGKFIQYDVTEFHFIITYICHFNFNLMSNYSIPFR